MMGPKSAWQVWRDRRGRLSPLRIAVLLLFLVPPALAVWTYLSAGSLGARPINDLIHRSGYWALLFILLSLSVTPLRRVTRYGSLIDVRRMIGVGAFVYATAHILLYVVEERFDLVKVASEIVKRLYLTIGLIAWLGLLTLAVTSTDAMVKRLGALKWRRLHQAIYVLGMLALIHFFQQTKADFTLPATITGLFGWLICYRIVAARVRGGELSTRALFILTLAVALLTFLVEAVGIGLWYRASPLRVLQTAFDFDLAIRPGWYVLAAGLAVVLVDLARSRTRQNASAPALDRATA
jgi:methionine sulfoxide reductase heme-binding subunit